MVYEMALGPIEAGKNICHHCDNPPCVRPDHLFQGSHADNVADKVRKGRASGPVGMNQTGEANHNARLTDADVRAIRALAASGTYQWEIARIFGVSQGNVNLVVNRKTWAHVE